MAQLPICDQDGDPGCDQGPPHASGAADRGFRAGKPAPSAPEASAGLKIGDLAKITGKTSRALRLYEELGLLAPDTRSHGGFRLYDTQAVLRVQWIAQLQELGFSLHEIQEIVLGARGPGVPREAMARVRGRFSEKLRDVADQIRRLQSLQTELARSLAYLESCHGCSAGEPAAAPAAHVCAGCADHGDEPTPSLIKGLTAVQLGAMPPSPLPSSSSSPPLPTSPLPRGRNP